MPRLHPLAHLTYDTIAFSFMTAVNRRISATAMGSRVTCAPHVTSGSTPMLP